MTIQSILFETDPPAPTYPGPWPYAEVLARVGDVLARGFDWSGWLANRWIPNEAAALNQVLRPNVPNGYQYICTQAGETGDIELIWPVGAGATVADGSAIWQAEAIDSTSLATTLSSASWSVSNSPNGGSVATSNPVVSGNAASVTINTASAIAGDDYDVLCAATMADGSVKTGKIRVKVR